MPAAPAQHSTQHNTMRMIQNGRQMTTTSPATATPMIIARGTEVVLVLVIGPKDETSVLFKAVERG